MSRNSRFLCWKYTFWTIWYIFWAKRIKSLWNAKKTSHSIRLPFRSLLLWILKICTTVSIVEILTQSEEAFPMTHCFATGNACIVVCRRCYIVLLLLLFVWTSVYFILSCAPCLSCAYTHTHTHKYKRTRDTVGCGQSMFGICVFIQHMFVVRGFS